MKNSSVEPLYGERYLPHRILPHLWHIQECLDNPGFMTLVVGKNKALLFDTGYGSGNLAETVKSITNLPVEVVLSHGHFDHVCAAWQFSSAWIHPADHALCLESSGAAMRASRWGINTRRAEAAPDLPCAIDYYSYVGGGCCPLRPLSEDQRFELGGITARVIPMPGHTAGSVGLLLEEDRIFLAGDSANPTFFLFTGRSQTRQDHLDNLRRALTLPFDHFLIGHRPALFPKETLRDFSAAAQKADPCTDRIHVMGNAVSDVIFRSQSGADSDPASCYMLYRSDQVVSPAPAVWEGENIIVAGADTPSGIAAAKRCLEKGQRVFAWVGRDIPRELLSLSEEYGAQLKILEEVFPDSRAQLLGAAEISGRLCGKNPDMFYCAYEDISEERRELLKRLFHCKFCRLQKGGQCI